MKVLVTGANGFLGREVVAALVADGHAVRALVRPSTDVGPLRWGGQVEVARADLRGGTELEALFAGVEAVVHLATQMKGDDFTIFSGTLLGTERLFAAMAASSTKESTFATKPSQTSAGATSPRRSTTWGRWRSRSTTAR